MPKTSPEYALRMQRKWLLEHFRADKNLMPPRGGLPGFAVTPATEGSVPTCRCWHCGKLLGERALFVSKVDPDGTTRRSNIRPACADHATLTTATVRSEPDLAAALRESFERRA